MSTVPYEYDASDSSDSIYDKETQAIGEIGDGRNIFTKIKGDLQKDGACNLKADNVLYDGPTQPLKFIYSAAECKSPTAGAQASLLKPKLTLTENFDSDCDTIPESPVLCHDSFCNEVDFQKTETKATKSTILPSDDDKTQPLPALRRLDTPIGTNRQDSASPEVVFYDGPTQRLVITNHTTLSCSDEETCISPSSASHNISVSDLDTLPISLPQCDTEVCHPRCHKESLSTSECSRAVTPLYDGPTQPLFLQSHIVGKRNSSPLTG